MKIAQILAKQALRLHRLGDTAKAESIWNDVKEIVRGELANGHTVESNNR